MYSGIYPFINLIHELFSEKFGKLGFGVNKCPILINVETDF